MKMNHETRATLSNTQDVDRNILLLLPIILIHLQKISLLVSLLKRCLMYFEYMKNLFNSAYTNYRGAMSAIASGRICFNVTEGHPVIPF